jgi:hypothetical protein
MSHLALHIRPLNYLDWPSVATREAFQWSPSVEPSFGDLAVVS